MSAEQSLRVYDPQEQREYLIPKDVAKELRVSPAKVREWIETGQLKAADIANGNRPRYIIRRADLDRFLQLRQVLPKRRAG